MDARRGSYSSVPTAHVARAGVLDSLAMLADVALPTLAKGIIVRRPHMVGLAERLGTDGRAVRRLQKLRARYGPGPLIFPVPGRPQAVILDPDQVRPILAAAPDPFSPATMEKASVLGHFEKNVSLISYPPERAARRRFNAIVLEEGCPVHSTAARLARIVEEEVDTMLAQAGERLSWDDFATAWYMIVRRLVLGDGARDDHTLTDMLADLRYASNWGFTHPGYPRLERRFHERLGAHIERAEPGSIAARAKTCGRELDVPATDQLAHYLFAYDPGGMTAFRTMALLATHPDAMARTRRELAEVGPGGRARLSYLRACVVDTLRLWPTTPAIFRETLRAVEFDGGSLPRGTHVMIFAPFFHRDEETLSFAHRFAPEIWIDGAEIPDLPLVPFSDGPGICPARDLVPMTISMAIAEILARRDIRLEQAGRLSDRRPIPPILDNYTLSFALHRR